MSCVLNHLEDGLDLAARLGAEYVDIRHVVDETEQLSARDRRLELTANHHSSGFGVRVMVDGAWGFAARHGDDANALEEAVNRAVASAKEIAAIHARLGVARGKLCEGPAERGSYETTVVEDSFAVPLDEKLELILAATDRLLAHAGTKGVSASAHVMTRRQRKHLVTSHGARIAQTIVHTGCGMKLTVADGALVQQRSYPMDLEGGILAGGYEVVRRIDLLGEIPRVADEALALLTAPECPSRTTTLVLDTPQLALQIHESAGHPTEGDRALGDEISLAGGSFLTPSLRGGFVYGSPLVTIVADATVPGALGTFGWDDEGTAARRTPLVEKGQFVGYLTSREVAARLGDSRSGGTVRAESWNRTPIVRMTNVSLEPDPRGAASLDELIADTTDGVVMGCNRSWSIDDVRLNFQFGCEIAWEIKHGKRTRLLRNPMYSGVTPKFWSSCDAIGGPSAFRMWGFASCGKGDPMQLIAVGHGCAPARFRDVEVGGSR